MAFEESGVFVITDQNGTVINPNRGSIIIRDPCNPQCPPPLAPKLSMAGAVIAQLTSENMEALAALVVERITKAWADPSALSVFDLIHEWGRGRPERTAAAWAVKEILHVFDYLSPVGNRFSCRAHLQSDLREYFNTIGDAVMAAYDKHHGDPDAG
jgi:hypothetical protein